MPKFVTDMKKLLLLAVAFALSAVAMSAQDKDDFGIWQNVTITGKLSPKWSVGICAEHRSKDMVQALDCALVMPNVSYKPWSFMKLDLASEYIMCGDCTQWSLRPSVSLYVPSTGDLDLSFRFLPIYEHTIETGEGVWTLRSRVKAAYNLESIHLTPYVSSELFTASQWKKTRHYVGAEYSFGKHSAIDVYYMYYIMAGKSWQRHVAGITYIFSIN